MEDYEWVRDVEGRTDAAIVANRRTRHEYIVVAIDDACMVMDFYDESLARLGWSTVNGYAKTSGRYAHQLVMGPSPSPDQSVDNLRAHKSVQMSQERIFTPVAQPYANPIEIVFSKLKASFRSLNASLPGLEVEDLVDRSVATISQSDVDNAIQHVRAFVEGNY